MSEKINEIIEEIIRKYKNKSISEIKELLNIQTNSKNENYIVLKKMIENYREGQYVDLFKDKKYVLKTVNFEWNDTLKESISLPMFRYKEIVKEEWEQSELRKYLLNNIFIFFCMKKNGKQKIFIGFCVWKMPLSMLDGDVKKTWEETKGLIQTGNIVKFIDNRGRYITNFPGKSSTKYVHVRPHARNKYDEIDLPVVDNYTKKNRFVKYSFWLNNSLIKKVLMEGKYND